LIGPKGHALSPTTSSSKITCIGVALLMFMGEWWVLI
jgi:hypothetical protein